MNRYIDADKTLDMMWNALYQYEDDMEKKNGLNLTERLDVQNGFGVAHKVVVDAPAEDVAPVKHGYWKANKDESGYFDVCICSECLTDFVDDLSWLVHDMELPPFCPYCGAKMDEEVKTDE